MQQLLEKLRREEKQIEKDIRMNQIYSLIICLFTLLSVSRKNDQAILMSLLGNVYMYMSRQGHTIKLEHIQMRIRRILGDENITS
jgi:hypothetical protein